MAGHDTVHTLLAYHVPERFDVFHAHSPWSALAAGVHLDQPIVHTVHGSFTEEMRLLYSEIADLNAGLHREAVEKSEDVNATTVQKIYMAQLDPKAIEDKLRSDPDMRRRLAASPVLVRSGCLLSPHRALAPAPPPGRGAQLR